MSLEEKEKEKFEMVGLIEVINSNEAPLMQFDIVLLCDCSVSSYSEQVSVPAWFAMDTRLGSISIHLDTPNCFSAEMYAVDLQVPNASEELKVIV